MLPKVQVDAVDMAAAIGTKETDVTAIEDNEESTVKVKGEAGCLHLGTSGVHRRLQLRIEPDYRRRSSKTDKAELTLDENNVTLPDLYRRGRGASADGSTKAEPKEITPS